MGTGEEEKNRDYNTTEQWNVTNVPGCDSEVTGHCSEEEEEEEEMCHVGGNNVNINNLGTHMKNVSHNKSLFCVTFMKKKDYWLIYESLGFTAVSNKSRKQEEDWILGLIH